LPAGPPPAAAAVAIPGAGCAAAAATAPVDCAAPGSVQLHTLQLGWVIAAAIPTSDIANAWTARSLDPSRVTMVFGPFFIVVSRLYLSIYLSI
jgi:hypothetical protein